MAEKYLKIIQNGVASYVPDNRRNRDFWAKQNGKVARSRSAHQEIVTILEASPEEVEFMQQSSIPAKGTSVPTTVVREVVNNSELELLKKMVDLQQEQIKSLLESKQTEEKDLNEKDSDDEPEFVDFSDEKPKGKPGPKPKNN